MMANLRIGNITFEGLLPGPMEISMKENGRMGKNMVKDHSHGRRVTIRMVIGILGNVMGKGHIPGPMGTSI